MLRYIRTPRMRADFGEFYVDPVLDSYGDLPDNFRGSPAFSGKSTFSVGRYTELCVMLH